MHVRRVCVRVPLVVTDRFSFNKLWMPLAPAGMRAGCVGCGASWQGSAPQDRRMCRKKMRRRIEPTAISEAAARVFLPERSLCRLAEQTSSKTACTLASVPYICLLHKGLCYRSSCPICFGPSAAIRCVGTYVSIVLVLCVTRSSFDLQGPDPALVKHGRRLEPLRLC